MHPGAYPFAHGQGICKLAKQQSLMLRSGLGSPVTLWCHNKGAAHITAANTFHRMQRPAAIGLQLRQAAVWAVVQPDSERDPLAGEQYLLVCVVHVCLFAAEANSVPWPNDVSPCLGTHKRLPSVHLTLLLHLEALLEHQLCLYWSRHVDVLS